MASTQVRLHIDFNAREVHLQAKDPLDVKPTAIIVPFAVWKAGAHLILKAESEDELSAMAEAGQLAPAEEPSKIITPGG